MNRLTSLLLLALIVACSFAKEETRVKRYYPYGGYGMMGGYGMGGYGMGGYGMGYGMMRPYGMYGMWGR